MEDVRKGSYKVEIAFTHFIPPQILYFNIIQIGGYLGWLVCFSSGYAQLHCFFQGTENTSSGEKLNRKLKSSLLDE